VTWRSAGSIKDGKRTRIAMPRETSRSVRTSVYETMRNIVGSKFSAARAMTAR
jgi:hypothetical protein